MEFRILGPLEVRDDGRAIALGASKQRVLLAVLLLASNRPVSVDRLIDAVWPTRPPAGAANALQYHVSRLRKLLGHAELILTKDPGYLIQIDPDQLDLLRFERLVSEAVGVDPERAGRLLGEALELWRGEPLADLVDVPGLQAEVRRLQEIHLAALELRIESDLAVGRHAQLVAELEVLVSVHPLRERLSGALMRALYGAGRQAQALEVYRVTRQAFVETLGIEPSPVLRELEQAILRQDPGLTVGQTESGILRSILVLAGDERRLDDLLALAEPLSSRPRRELLLARLAAGPADLAASTVALAARRNALAARGVPCRVAVYTTSVAEAGAEAARLATEQPVDLVLAEAPEKLLDGDAALGGPLSTLLDQAPCDVGLLVGGRLRGVGPIVTPFGGAEHDWSAIELAAWLAASLDTTLRLLGVEADHSRGRRDASRLLARASLLVQQVVGIVTEPVLIPAGDRGVVDAAEDARLLVVGLSDRWVQEGIGAVRLAVAVAAHAPVLFIRSGLRPSGLAPPQTLTRFTWTVASHSA